MTVASASRWWTALGLAVMVTSPGAQEQVPTHFDHARAMLGCTQEDGRALEVYLTVRAYDGSQPTPAPHLRIEVQWSEWGTLLGQTLSLVPLSRAGLDPAQLRVRAALQPSSGAPQWLHGSLILDHVDVGRRVDARYDFSGDEGRLWRGVFTAGWADTLPGCG